MTRPEDVRAISVGAYREQRAYLADRVFLAIPGGGTPPDDVLGQEEWEGFMDLPTDVLLRTTDYMGRMVDDMSTQAHAWLCTLPADPAKAQFMFDAHLDTHDELKAAPFIAAHGWYRQATAGLRNALEVMTHAARYAVRNDAAGYAAWRAGSADPPRFGNSTDQIGQTTQIGTIEDHLGGAALFGVRPNGVMRDLYADVCRYAHSQPGHTNADIWQSNGPVFIGRAFTQFWLDFCDVLLACYVLLKVGYPPLELPSAVDGIAGNAGEGWHGLAPAAIAAYFP
jgi:hypothetical protein